MWTFEKSSGCKDVSRVNELQGTSLTTNSALCVARRVPHQQWGFLMVIKLCELRGGDLLQQIEAATLELTRGRSSHTL